MKERYERIGKKNYQIDRDSKRVRYGEIEKKEMSSLKNIIWKDEAVMGKITC